MMKEEFSTLTITCLYNILFANDIACSTVIDGIDSLKRSPLYRYEVKKHANLVSRERHKYETMVNSVISSGNHEFLANANDVIAEKVNKHLDILYWSIKREFDKFNIENSQLLARLELARTMVAFAAVNIKKRIDEMKEQGVAGNRINYLSLDPLLKLMDNLLRTFNVTVEVDMNTPECKMSIEIIGKCLCDGNLIANAIKE